MRISDLLACFSAFWPFPGPQPLAALDAEVLLRRYDLDDESSQVASARQISQSALRDKLGSHVMVDFKATHETPTIDKRLLRKLLQEAVSIAGANQLFVAEREDEAGNISVVVVISESHFALHYCRQSQTFILDWYTCGNINSKLAQHFLRNRLRLQRLAHKQRYWRGLIDHQGEFLLGLGQKACAKQPGLFHAPLTSEQTIANHVMLEVYSLKSDVIHDGQALIDHMAMALELGSVVPFASKPINFKAQLVTHLHQFEPHGLSVVVMGAGFHATVHTWPEYQYAAFDVFGRNEVMNAKKAAFHLAQKGLCSAVNVGRGLRPAIQHP